MAQNEIQFQPGLSLPELMSKYGYQSQVRGDVGAIALT